MVAVGKGVFYHYLLFVSETETETLPPVDCLQNVPKSKWIYSKNLGYHQAFQFQSKSEDKSPDRA